MRQAPAWVAVWRDAGGKLADRLLFRADSGTAGPSAGRTLLSTLYIALLARFEPLWRKDIDAALERIGRSDAASSGEAQATPQSPVRRFVEVKPLDDGFPRGAIDLHNPSGDWIRYVPLSTYVDALRAASADQMRLRVALADRLIAIAEEGQKLGSLSLADVEYLRRCAEKERTKT